MPAATARLLDVNATAAHFGGVTTAFVRALVSRGELMPVRLPSCRRPGESNRRLLFDVRDLDALIDRWKATSSAAPNAQLSAAALKGWREKPIRTRKNSDESTTNAAEGA